MVLGMTEREALPAPAWEARPGAEAAPPGNRWRFPSNRNDSGGRKKVCAQGRGGGALEPLFQKPPLSGLTCRGPRRAVGGVWGGGGSRGTPTHMAQFDPHDAMIILRHVSWGIFFLQKKNFPGCFAAQVLLCTGLSREPLSQPPPPPASFRELEQPLAQTTFRHISRGHS